MKTHLLCVLLALSSPLLAAGPPSQSQRESQPESQSDSRANSQSDSQAERQPPNIIYLMLDEWGYFESGHMGNTDLLTPNIDRFASEGMRFTNALAGAPVCGPTRCVLLTGLHSGHTSMRVNDGFSPIRADEPTISSMLKRRGYATGGFGKWGIGGRGTSGVPERHGFDEFFGYYDQVHAHTFYPRYLIRNSQEVMLPGNDGLSFYDGETHAQKTIFEQSVRFIRENKDRPFFCYLPWTPPHGLWGIDADDPSWLLFKDKPWTAGQRTDRDARVYAAFLHMVDRQLGEIMKLVKELGLDDNTVFFLCGDNGGQAYFTTKQRPHGFFGPNLDPKTGKRFRAGKGSLYEGGLKVPYLVRWPGKTDAGSVSEHVMFFGDVMPTLAELAGADCPETDGISVLPTLVGKQTQQRRHPYLYWEYAGQKAVRSENWKAYQAKKGSWELYDLANDMEEKINIASKHPDVLERLVTYADESHQPVRPGTVFDRRLTEKDHRQAPHQRNVEFLRESNAGATDDRPNIILAMGDDHGWEETQYNGHPHVKTPVLDDMAAKGLRLNRFYAGHPSCSPTRGSVLTGRHPNRYGTFTPGRSIRPKEITIARILQQAGYATGHFGKWHLGPVKAASPTNPGKMGFDEWFSHDNFFELNPHLSRNGGPPIRYAGESSKIIVDDTIRFIRDSAEQKKPFLAIVWFGSPHEPYSGLESDLKLYDNLPEKYAERTVSLTSNETGVRVKRSLREVLRERYAEITAMDRAIGSLRNFLASEGLRENTLIWYCGDNGTPPSGVAESPLRGMKGQMFEGGIRVPGIIEWPARIANPRRSDVCAVTSDMLPTICDIVNQPLPPRPLDGISLLQLIDGTMQQRPSPIGFWSFANTRRSAKPYIDPELQKGTTPLVKLMGGIPTRNFQNHHHPAIVDQDYTGERTLVDNRYKLLISKNEDVQLFDLIEDLAESNNIADQHPKIVAAMTQKMRDWQESVLNSLMENDY